MGVFDKFKKVYKDASLDKEVDLKKVLQMLLKNLQKLCLKKN